MNRLLSLLLFAVVGLTLSAGFAGALSSLTQDEGSSWSPRALADQMAQEVSKKQRLDRDCEAMVNAQVARQKVIHALIAGDITVEQAVVAFHETDAQRLEACGEQPPTLDSVRRQEMTQRVIWWLQGNRTDDKARIAALLGELRPMFAKRDSLTAS